MLDYIRSHQRLMFLVLLLVISPPFVFFGISSSLKFNGDSDAYATVAGRAITPGEFHEAQLRQAEQLRARLGARFDMKMLDSKEMRQAILDNLISERVMQAATTREHLFVSNRQVSEALRDDPTIQTLYGPDGKLDEARYDQLLNANGKTRDGVFEDTRRSMLINLVGGTVSHSSLTPKALLTQLDSLLAQSREVEELDFHPDAYRATVTITDEQIAKYYADNAKVFELPEQVDVQYLVFDQHQVAAGLKVSPEEVSALYKQNLARYTTLDERRASHILVAVAKDATPAVREKAHARALEALAKVRAHPADFAKLAKEYSNDPASAERGGDLDWAPASNYVPEFSKALFALRPNEISDLVETEYGYHIIALTGVRPGRQKPIEEVSAQIESQLRQQHARDEFAKLAEDFRNTVYQQADSLDPAAAEFNLKVQSATGVTRSGAMAAPVAALNDSVREALFSDDVLDKHHNTEAIETGPDTLVAARVTAHRAAAARPLSEVQDAIRVSLRDKAAVTQAAIVGAERLAALQKNGDATGFTGKKKITRLNPQGLPRSAVKDIFKADLASLPAYTNSTLPDGTYAIYRIVAVSQPPENATASGNIASLGREIAQQNGALEQAGYLEALKKEFSVKISPDFSGDAAKLGS